MTQESAVSLSARNRTAGVHLDHARKHYGREFVVALLQRMASLGLTELQLHVSENEGFRLASARRPELMSDSVLGRNDTDVIVETADRLGIAIVPALDIPGHAAWILHRYPHLALADGRGGWVPRALDLDKPETVDLVRDLHDELAEQFPTSTEWHIGFDEIIEMDDPAAGTELASRAQQRFGEGATASDLLTQWANATIASVAERGVRSRLWNDALFRAYHVTLDRRAIITWWTNWHRDMAPLTAALEAGHDIINCNDALFYFVLGEAAGYRYPTAERIREADWNPGVFPALPGGGPQRIDRDHPHLAGSLYCIWSDKPEALSPDAVLTRIDGSLAEFAKRAVGAH